eukprot:COSAG02_NODE_3980_length_5959_cov_4.500512_1_plen_196_part_00
MSLHSCALQRVWQPQHDQTRPSSVVDYKWNGTAAVSVGPNNMLLLARGNPDRGVMHDTHEHNSSRRYKAFGSFWSNLCRGQNSTTPTTAHDGSLFPPCHNLGVAFSADGVHFDHAQDEDAYDPGNVPGLDKVGQNDGALDLAMWDADLGSYWSARRAPHITLLRRSSSPCCPCRSVCRQGSILIFAVCLQGLGST